MQAVLHSLVLMNRPDDKGVYRRIPVRIMGAYTEPVEPHLIVDKMAELLSKNEIRKGAIFSYIVQLWYNGR